MQSDITKLKGEIPNERNAVIRKNKENIIKYLKNIIIPNLNRFNRLRLRWCVSDGGNMSTYPVQLLSMRRCGLNIVDYMCKTDENTVEIDFKKLWDAMAFVLAHDDLGFSIESIETRLQDCNLMGVNNSNVFAGMIDSNTYNDVNMMRIEHSDFVFEDMSAVDYFGTKLGKATYKEIIKSSIDRMMACIIYEVLEGINKGDYDIEFIGLFESAIYFNTNMDRNTILEQLHSNVTLKMFGRDFEFVPTIRIY